MTTRFPSGPKALASYIHARGAEVWHLQRRGHADACQGYYGSQGCAKTSTRGPLPRGELIISSSTSNNDASRHATGYPTMGRALQSRAATSSTTARGPPTSGTTKLWLYDAMSDAGCHLWRNWHDVQCDWSSVRTIMNHWGNNSVALEKAAGRAAGTAGTPPTLKSQFKVPPRH